MFVCWAGPSRGPLGPCGTAAALLCATLPGAAFAEPEALNSRLAAQGLALDATVVGDYSRLADGGVRPNASAVRYLVEAGLTLDTESAIGLPGGTLRLAYLGFHGDNGNLDSGDAQTYSNIDETPFDALYSLWYQQALLEGRLHVKLGKMDANDDFAYVDNASGFLNSSAGFSPTIQAFPSYPDPATALNVFAGGNTGPYAGAGIYDGATQAGIPTGTHGPETFLGAPSDLFWITEIGTRYALHDLPGRIAFGYWRHTGEFERFDGGSDDHADGGYALWEQTVHRASASSHEIGAFLQYGFANSAVSQIDAHVGAGLTARALVPGRSDDVTGVMASYAGFSDAARSGFTEGYELSLEMFHALTVAKWLTIKPDLQYIVNPGGAGLANAAVATLRVELTL